MHSPRGRKFTNLSDSINRQLNTYALAAVAAGVGTLARTQPAQAEIVYTPTHIAIPKNSIISIDFRDSGGGTGFAEFSISRGSSNMPTGSLISAMWVEGYSAHTNPIRSVAAIPAGSHVDAVALRLGTRMGPHRRVNRTGLMALLFVYATRSYRRVWNGQWANSGKGLKNGYLGFKFALNDEVHYGWARVSLTVTDDRLDTATLTGYAFETIPNKSIVIGKTHGPDVITVQPDIAPGSLGRLALGRK